MMNSTVANFDSTNARRPFIKKRGLSHGRDAIVLSDIYNEEINIVTWQRNLSESLVKSAGQFLISNPRFETTMNVSPQTVGASISKGLRGQAPELAADIADLVTMFCDLFELPGAGLRLCAMRQAMCPKFHVDKIPARLITTYQGPATQWLPHEVVNRSKLGTGSNGLLDHESGLYPQQSDIQQLGCGHVALLKGEYWEDNENAGLVHRSPALAPGETRLVLTLDFAYE